MRAQFNSQEALKMRSSSHVLGNLQIFIMLAFRATHMCFARNQKVHWFARLAAELRCVWHSADLHLLAQRRASTRREGRQRSRHIYALSQRQIAERETERASGGAYGHHRKECSPGTAQHASPQRPALAQPHQRRACRSAVRVEKEWIELARSPGVPAALSSGHERNAHGRHTGVWGRLLPAE